MDKVTSISVSAVSTGNYDRSREPLNFEIKKGSIISSVDKRKSIPQLMAENLESNPHIHMTLLPIDKDKKFAFKKMFAGKDKYEYKEIMLALHDELAKVNEKWGLKMTRSGHAAV